MVAQGTTLAGRYRLDDRLGAGGMGEVWRGEDIVLARTVAVKLLLPDRMNDPGFVVRFQGEARAMATINHPGVVDVYDYGVTEVPGDGPTAFLVMRFVDGEPLDRLLTRLGRIAPEPAMELIAQAADAMQAVHERGIVHRDIKPGNLLVRADGRLVLTDFGIARSEAANRLTDAGMVLGTAAYCAPEQAEGQPVTPLVDIYALGVVAYECLAGQRPFDGESPVTIALKHIREAPPPLPPELPPAVRHVVERALAKDPGSRWPSAAAMGQAARQAILTPAAAGTQSLQGEPPPTHHPPPYAQPYPSEPYPSEPYPSEPYPSEPYQQTLTGQGHARPRRSRAGLFTGIAVGAALFGGLAAFGINSVAATGDQESPPAAIRSGAGDPSVGSTQAPQESPRPTRPRTHRPPTKEPATSRPSRTPKPSSTPSTSSTPKPTKTTTSPTPTPTVLRKVPYVEGLSEQEALATLRKAGLSARVVVSDDPDTGLCTEVLAQDPEPERRVPAGTAVRLVVDRGVECPGEGSPTPSPTPSP
ncbi:serine/threonine protein kinase [Thermopolyspora sp. NPDC052614]|uniref:serine/threonine protein kinase n=1 Tax=Thermopolyspora sp. NPDC052614 TaxID=3155682 RepID=UPI003446218C